jgi:hypothetical protein
VGLPSCSAFGFTFVVGRGNYSEGVYGIVDSKVRDLFVAEMIAYRETSRGGAFIVGLAMSVYDVPLGSMLLCTQIAPTCNDMDMFICVAEVIQCGWEMSNDMGLYYLANEISHGACAVTLW